MKIIFYKQRLYPVAGFLFFHAALFGTKYIEVALSSVSTKTPKALFADAIYELKDENKEITCDRNAPVSLYLQPIKIKSL